MSGVPIAITPPVTLPKGQTGAFLVELAAKKNLRTGTRRAHSTSMPRSTRRTNA